MLELKGPYPKLSEILIGRSKLALSGLRSVLGAYFPGTRSISLLQHHCAVSNAGGVI